MLRNKIINSLVFTWLLAIKAIPTKSQDDFPAKLAKDIEEDASTTSRILSNGTQPLFNLDHIKYIIELGQLANTKSSTLYYHAHNLIPDLENIIASLRRSSVDVKASSRSVLPPSSAQSFLKEKPL